MVGIDDLKKKSKIKLVAKSETQAKMEQKSIIPPIS